MTTYAHEHAWVEAEDNPLLEDARAIFRYECDYAPVIDSYTSPRHDERFYEHGDKCEATKQYSFEIQHVRIKNEKHDLYYNPNSVYHTKDGEVLEKTLPHVEAHNQPMDSNAEITSCVPNEESGWVKVVNEDAGVTVVYKA
jgi:hypothetical protein